MTQSEGVTRRVSPQIFKWEQRSLTQMNQIVKAGFIIVIEETFHSRQAPKVEMLLRFFKCSVTSWSERLHSYCPCSARRSAYWPACIQEFKQIIWTYSQQLKAVK